MGLIDWMKSGNKKGKDVKVKKIKEQAVGEMAAGNQTAATAALGRMMAQKNAISKILMVQDGSYIAQVTDYALKMAQRLDCEVIALDVTATPLQFSGDRQERESQRFQERATTSNTTFCRQAESLGVKTTHIMEVGDQETIIARLSSDDAGIRYVLTKPDQESIRANEDQVQVPVFDLNCSRIAG